MHYITQLPQSILIGTILVIVAIGLIIALIVAHCRHPYRKVDQLFTPAERNFMKALQAAVSEKFYIAGKVRVADLLQVKIPKNNRRYWQAFKQISSKHVDYVLCDPATFDILCAIELDDRSHERKERKGRDEFLNAAFQAAGLPLVRFKVGKNYDPSEIRQKIIAAHRAQDQNHSNG